MSGQLESRHFFRAGDVVRSLDGGVGVAVEAGALHATVEWNDGGAGEVEQFDTSLFVESRGSTRAYSADESGEADGSGGLLL